MANENGTNPSPIKVILDKYDSTAGTVKLMERGDKAFHNLGNMYLKRRAWDQLGRPDSIIVTIDRA